VTFPEVDDVDFLLIMGGPMSVYDEDEYPWLREEKDFIRAVIQAGKKVLGICLGSQLIAEVLGAKVYPNAVKEIGWFPVTKTESGKTSALIADFPVTSEVFHWHGDTYDLPAGCAHLFISNECCHQAFEYQGRVVGLQFHLETVPELLEAMIENGLHEMNVGGKCVQTVTEIKQNYLLCLKTNRLMNSLLDKLIKTNN
jgi:GMP synthase-like glutamine amidotransferase